MVGSLTSKRLRLNCITYSAHFTYTATLECITALKKTSDHCLLCKDISSLVLCLQWLLPLPPQVKCNAVRALGNLLHFLRCGQLTRTAFQRPLEDAVRALVHTVQSEATMKVRWNACYALGNAFRNPALPLGNKTLTVNGRNILLLSNMSIFHVFVI